MMCHYVVCGSIKDHTPSQIYLWDSLRAYQFTFALQVVGIIITLVANLWNASVDKTFMNWLRRQKCYEYFERGEKGKGFEECLRYLLCCGCCRKAEQEQEEQSPSEAPADPSADPPGNEDAPEEPSVSDSEDKPTTPMQRVHSSKTLKNKLGIKTEK